MKSKEDLVEKDIQQDTKLRDSHKFMKVEVKELKDDCHEHETALTSRVETRQIIEDNPYEIKLEIDLHLLFILIMFIHTLLTLDLIRRKFPHIRGFSVVYGYSVPTHGEISTVHSQRFHICLPSICFLKRTQRYIRTRFVKGRKEVRSGLTESRGDEVTLKDGSHD